MTTVEQRQAERDRAGAMFVEIAHTAHAIKRLASMLTGNGVTSLEDEAFGLVALESLAERAGLLADLGAAAWGRWPWWAAWLNGRCPIYRPTRPRSST